MRPKQRRPEGGLPNSPEVRYAAFSGVLFLLDEPRSLRLRSRAASLPKLRVQNGVRCWMNNGKHLLALSFSAFDPGRVKTFFLPQKLQAAGRDPRGRDRLSIFLLYRVWSQSGRNLEPC